MNELCWRDLRGTSFSNAIALTFVWYFRFDTQSIEAGTIFNNASGFA